MSNQMVEGKVANIISERELAINIGAAHGVRKGMKFKIMADQPTEIPDPETGEILGVIEREKVRVQVTEVFEKFSVCRTYRMTSTGSFAFGAFADMLTRPARTVETLRADESSYIPPLAESESYVKKGDRVVPIEDDV